MTPDAEWARQIAKRDEKIKLLEKMTKDLLILGSLPYTNADVRLSRLSAGVHLAMIEYKEKFGVDLDAE